MIGEKVVRNLNDIGAGVFSEDLLPGQHVFMICEDGSEHRGEMFLRKAGLEIRDSIRWFHGSPVKHLTVVVGRKPLQGTVAENVLRYGCGGINIDACRIPTTENDREEMLKLSRAFEGKKWGRIEMANYGYSDSMPEKTVSIPHENGRWPANVIHDGACEALFPYTISSATKRNRSPRQDKTQWRAGGSAYDTSEYGDSGSASRFFYTATTMEELTEYLNRLVTP